jgi:hypothetical protein
MSAPTPASAGASDPPFAERFFVPQNPFLCLPAEEFEALKMRFRLIGVRLSDDQLLELADIYHEMLRARRDRRSGFSGCVGEMHSFAPRERRKAGGATDELRIGSPGPVVAGEGADL